MDTYRTPSERVAVIVVHGVADQPPFDSVRQVANLLANVNVDGHPAYAEFTEDTLRIPVRPLPPPAEASPAGQSFYQTAAQSTETTGIEIDQRLTETLLANYTGEGPRATYDTIRLSGTRKTPSREVKVDLFEMYWADLSRVGVSAFRILGELYQVLLHVGSLGKHAAVASVEDYETFAAQGFKATTAAASWWLAGPIAIFNAWFLVAAALVLSSLIPAGAHLGVALAVLVIAAFAAISVVLLQSAGTTLAYKLGVAVLVILGGAALLARASVGDAPSLNPTGMLAAVMLIVGLVGVALVLRAYNRRRPGSRWIAIPGGVLVAVVGLLAFSAERQAGARDEFSLLVIPGFRITEALYIVLRYSWVVFLVVFLASLVMGGLYRRGITDAVERAAASRAIWTARIALVIPAAAFLIVTIALWSGLDVSLQGQFSRPYQVSSWTRMLLPASHPFATVMTGDAFIDQVLESSLGREFVVPAMLMTLGVLLAIVALAPIVWTEVIPPPTNHLTRQIGVWLTSAFAVLRGSGRLMVAAFVLWPALIVVSLFVTLPPLANVEPSTLVTALGLAVAVPSAGLLAFRGSVQKLAVGFRAPVDVLLDVDGYLREHPRDSAPRARVFARYYSLLRHIADAPVAYDKVVVIAHSQGTVITADLFRYMTRRNLWRLKAPVTLFTMGSPLRQLYARRFPDLYKWVWHDAAAIAEYKLPDIVDDRQPRPAELRVTRWVNAYRSGDYVGRWLWRPDVCGYQFDAPRNKPWEASKWSLAQHSVDNDSTRIEFCIGAGAHTHYWDGTAGEIAVALDSLVRGSLVAASQPLAT